jgi:hypothetical protein
VVSGVTTNSRQLIQYEKGRQSPNGQAGNGSTNSRSLQSLVSSVCQSAVHTLYDMGVGITCDAYAGES